MSTTITIDADRHVQPPDTELRALQRARAAERMRHSRKMRRNGLKLIPLWLRDAEITALVTAGFLAADDKRDPHAVAQALGKWIDTTGLRPRRTASRNV